MNAFESETTYLSGVTYALMEIEKETSAIAEIDDEERFEVFFWALKSNVDEYSSWWFREFLQAHGLPEHINGTRAWVSIPVAWKQYPAVYSKFYIGRIDGKYMVANLCEEERHGFAPGLTEIAEGNYESTMTKLVNALVLYQERYSEPRAVAA